MPEILFVVDITGDNIHMYAARKKSPAYIVAVALYFLYFYFLVNGSKGVLCYSYFYVNLCFKYKNKVIIEWSEIEVPRDVRNS